MSETEGEQFSLRWNNFHSNLSAGFNALLEGEDLVDVTLAADGQFVQAHKIVLSVCSPYFKDLFKVNPCKHPIVILKDVCHKELVAILQFMYQGEVNVRQEELAAFLKTAEMLQIKGLTGDDSPAANTSTSVPKTPERMQSSRTQPSLIEPLVVQSEEPPARPYKRMRAEASAPQPQPSVPASAPPVAPSSASVPSPLRVNEDTSGVEFVEMSKPKVEPVDYESDIEEVEKLPGRDDPLVQLLGGESSSHSLQDASQGSAPLFASIPALPQDTGGSQDGGQDSSMLTLPLIMMHRTQLSKGTNKPSFPCHLCDKTFTWRNSLQTHVSNIHGDSRGPFPCPICGKLSKNKKSLTTHLHDFHRK